MPELDDKTSNRWKTVRVFISSTFRDMHAERDHLVRLVFPRLREELMKCRIHLVDVDLRWGVTCEQDASEVCREIINECRPRFLCMLGGRYGWVPPGKTRSITAYEVHYGVLDRTLKDRGFAYFYFRDDVATAAMVETTPSEFREPQGSYNQNKLAELKQAIVATGINPFTYQAQWDNESRRLTGLKQFGDRVYDDLLASMKSDPELQDRFVTDTAAQPDEFAEENAAIEAFVEERSERFVLGSREVVLKELLVHARATGGNGYVCLTGAPGSGKSALLAYLYRKLTALSPSPPSDAQPSAVCTPYLVIPHFVGASPGSTDVRRTLRRLCHELKAGCPEITADIPEDPEKLRVAFPDYLRQACEKKRVVILLDAVNQFDPASHSAGLYWLPEDLPDNARVIVTALVEPRNTRTSRNETVEETQRTDVSSPLAGEEKGEGNRRNGKSHPALEELRRRLKPHEIELEALTAADGEMIIEQFRKRYHKRFTSDQRASLLAKTDAGTPLYLLAALEELRTLGTYEEITRRIAELPPTTHELFGWILERLENEDGFRDAAGRRVGHELVSRFAALLGASHYGLSQRELGELLAPGDSKAQPSIPVDAQGNVAALLHLLRPYLMRRGELLDFYHGQFRVVATEAWLETEEQQHAAHIQLADYFETQWSSPSVHALQELPYQRTKGQNWAGMERVLCDLQFIEAKCSFGMGYDLLEDYDFARQSSTSSSIRLPHLSTFHNTFRSELHVLSNRPEHVFQQFNDHLQWSRDQDAAIDGMLSRAEEIQHGKHRRWIQNEFRRSGAEMILVGHEVRVTSCTYLPEEQLLASGDSAGTLRLWSLTYGNCRASVDTGVPIRKLLVCGRRSIVVQNVDGRILVCPSNAQSGHLAGEVTEDIATSISSRPDGSVLVAYKSGRLVTVAHTSAGFREEQHNGLPGQTAAISHVPGSHLIALGESVIVLHQGTERAKYDANENIRALQISPDGKWLAAETFKGILCFDLAEAGANGVLKPSVIIDCYGFGVGSSEMIWISNERLLWIRRQPHIYNARTGLCEATLRQFGHWRAQCGCQVDRETVAIGLNDGRIELWRLPQSGPTRIHKAGNSPVISCFLGNSHHEIISVLKDGRVVLQGDENRREIALIPTAQGSPACAAYEPATHSLVVGTDHGHVLAVGAESPWPVTQLYSHRSEVLSIRFSPDFHLLATSSRDRRIIVYQTEGGAIQSVLARHRRRVTGFAWHTNGRQLFSTSTDHTLRVWDAVKGFELVTCKSRGMLLASLALDPLGHEVAGCDYAGCIQRFTVQCFWDFLNWRSRGWREWGVSSGNSEDAFAKAARLPIAFPPLPKSSPWNGISRCEYIAAGVLAYAWNSDPLVLLDMDDEDVVATFSDEGLLYSGEAFTPTFFVDKRSGFILRGTSAGRVFVWKLPDEFIEQRTSLRGSVVGWKPAEWEIADDGSALTAHWANGIVTILETHPRTATRTFSIDRSSLAGAGIATAGTSRYLVAARSGSRTTLREALFVCELSERQHTYAIEDPVPEYVNTGRPAIVHLRTSQCDGEFVVVQEDGLCSLWSAERCSQRAYLGRLPISTNLKGAKSSFSMDGRFLAVVTTEGQMALWDTKDASQISTRVDSYRGDEREHAHIEWLVQEQLQVGEPVGIWIVRDGSEVVVIGKAGMAVTVEVRDRARQMLWSTKLPDIRHLSDYVEAADILIAGDGCGRLAAIRLSEGNSETLVAQGISTIRASSVLTTSPLTVAIACDSTQVQFREWEGWREIGTYWAHGSVLCLKSVPGGQRCVAIDQHGNVLLLKICE